MSALLELAERCEQATGPNSELDAAIWLDAVADDTGRDAVRIGREQYGDAEAEFRISRLMDGQAYTASVDAALTLVPDGLLFAVTNCGAQTNEPDFTKATALVGNPDDANDPSEAATPALALCAAALRARAAL